MSCSNPITVKDGNGNEVKVPCGKCLTCRLKKAKDWAIKLQKESLYHKENCTITLTFDNEKLQNDKKCQKYGGNIRMAWRLEYSKEYLQKFIKRLRKHYKNKDITYYAVGEYGELKKRPHYHLILFGINFHETRKQGYLSKSGKPQFIDEKLTEIWGAGRVTIQDLNSKNVVYVAQYTLKKTKNKQVEEKYKPKMTFSNRSKIGYKWARRNHEEIKKGYITDEDKKKYSIPRTWLREFKERDYYKRFNDSILKHEQAILEKVGNKTDKEIIEQYKIKERLWELGQTNKKRDFC